MLDDPLLKKQDTRHTDDFASSSSDGYDEGTLKISEEMLDAVLEKGATEHAALLKQVKTQVRQKLD